MVGPLEVPAALDGRENQTLSRGPEQSVVDVQRVTVAHARDVVEHLQALARREVTVAVRNVAGVLQEMVDEVPQQLHRLLRLPPGLVPQVGRSRT